VTLSKVMKSESAVLFTTYQRHKVLADHGKGVYLYDEKGRKYLDFLSGIGVNALGYAHPAVLKTIREQAAKLIHTSNLFYHPFQSQLAARLTKLAGLDRAFFCNSGTEAWEGALKFARAYASVKYPGKGRTKILALENSFHGRSTGALATTWKEKYRKPFKPLLPGVVFVKFDDVDDLRKKFDGKVCAVCIEPVQGEGGIHPVSKEFMKVARELTAKSGALLLIDEIQSGLGRTGKWFAFQHYGVKPDVVTLAKPLAAGIPMGAVLASGKVAEIITPGMHGTTFGGGPLACATALTVLDVMEKDKLVASNAELGEYFLSGLRALDSCHPEIVDVRGVGLMVGLELDSPELAKAVTAQMLEEGIIINCTHETTLRFLPPYLITRKHIETVVAALDRILTSCASNGDALPKKAGKALAGGSKKATGMGRCKKK
jgi:acetylornithine aminotransferase/acetylornithine/N-succinyldiaminopimelate aminotransferase